MTEAKISQGNRPTPSSSQNFSAFLWNPEGSLPHSQEPTSCPPAEPQRTSRRPSPYFLNVYLNTTAHLRLCLQSDLFPSSFPTKKLYASVHHTLDMPRPSHSSWFGHPIVSVEQYKSRGSSLYSLVQSPVTSSPFGPNTLVLLHSSSLLLTFDAIGQCFSTAGPRPGTGPWHQLYRAARGSPGRCHFRFLSIFHK